MAQYRGTISGRRGEASRLGDKRSGLTTECNGWSIGAQCSIEYNAEKDRDEIRITLTSGSHHNNQGKYLGTFYETKNGTYRRV